MIFTRLEGECLMLFSISAHTQFNSQRDTQTSCKITSRLEATEEEALHYFERKSSLILELRSTEAEKKIKKL